MSAYAILGLAWMIGVFVGIWAIAILLFLVVWNKRTNHTKSTVGELQVKVTADTSQFDAAIERAGNKAREVAHLGAKETV